MTSNFKVNIATGTARSLVSPATSHQTLSSLLATTPSHWWIVAPRCGLANHVGNWITACDYSPPPCSSYQLVWLRRFRQHVYYIELAKTCQYLLTERVATISKGYCGLGTAELCALTIIDLPSAAGLLTVILDQPPYTQLSIYLFSLRSGHIASPTR